MSPCPNRLTARDIQESHDSRSWWRSSDSRDHGWAGTFESSPWKPELPTGPFSLPERGRTLPPLVPLLTTT